MNWKPGDIARLVRVNGDAVCPELYGETCELLQYLGTTRGAHSIVEQAWRVRFADRTCLVNQRCLRPIDDGSTWDKIEAITRWRPDTVNAEA